MTDEPTSEQVLRQLAAIGGARAFRASERQRRLLDHLVKKRLSGQVRELTQRHLADAVFARGPEFDPETDAIVRVEVRNLRRSLAAYYAREGAADPVLITIPTGAYVPQFQVVAPRTVEQATPATPFRIAIAGFRDTSDNARGSWLAEGILAELSTLLGRIPELQLLPPYQGSTDPDERRHMRWLHEQHQVRFALEGTTRLVGKGVRVHVFLHDLVQDRQVWAGRYDRVVDPDSLLALGEDIARHVVAEAVDPYTGVIGESLRREVDGSAISRDPEYKAQILFHRYLHEVSDVTYQKAREAVELAREQHPDNPMLLSMTADLRRASYALGFSDDENPADMVLALNEGALQIAPGCIPCRASLCFTLLFRRDLGRLHREIESILGDVTAPTSYFADAAVPLALSGQWTRGCQLLEQSMAGTLSYPHYFQYPFFLRDFRNGDYALAAEQGRRLADTGFFWRPMLNAAVSGKIGDRESADCYRKELLRLRPNIESLAARSLASYLAEDALVEDLLDGLRLAGLNV